MAKRQQSTISLSAFADDMAILHIIAKERVKHVKAKDEFSDGQRSREPELEKTLQSITPQYRLWRKFGNTGFSGTEAKYRQLRKGLARLMASDLGRQDMPQYAIRLREFVDSVKAAATSGDFNFGKPDILAQLKDHNGNRYIYRPISSYKDLKTKVVIALLSDYLATVFDKHFHTEMLAFRKPREYHGHNDYVTTNHDAIDRILEYRKAHENDPIYVTECDIQTFFDIIDHDVVMTAFDEIASKVAGDDKKVDLGAARRLLQSFVESYSFVNDVLSKNGDEEFWHSRLGNGWSPSMECRFKSIKLWENTRPGNPQKIGIPQGGLCVMMHKPPYVECLIMHSVLINN